MHVWCKHVFEILLRTLLVYRHPFAAMLVILQIIHCIEPGVECLIFASVQGHYFILRPSFVTSAATLLHVWEELRILYSLPHIFRVTKSRRIMSWTCRTQREITGALSILVWRSEGGGGRSFEGLDTDGGIIQGHFERNIWHMGPNRKEHI
jgi:hypothetical protein